MKSHTLSVLSMVGRVVGKQAAATTTTTTTIPYRVHASTYARTHAPVTTARTITTESESRGPARSVTEREHDEEHEYILESAHPSIPLVAAPLAQYVLNKAARWSHKTGMVCGLTGRSYTVGQVIDGAMRFGRVLQKLMPLEGAIQKGEEAGMRPTMAILAPNCPEYPMSFFGALVAGATVTVINPTYTPAEIAQQLQDSGAAVLVVDAILEPLANAALGLMGKAGTEGKEGVSVIVNGPSQNGRPNLMDIVVDPNVPFAEMAEPHLESTAVLPYSSGTTGKPKGVCLSHRAVSNNLEMYHHPNFLTLSPAEGDSQDELVGLLPFFHIYGMSCIMASGLVFGSKVITLPRFEPQSFISILAKNKISVLHLVPPLLNFLAMSPAVPASVLSSIHSILIGAAPVSPVSAALFKKKAARPIFFQEGFGMTEVQGTQLTPIGQEKLGWCGKVMPPARVKVVDLETGVSLPPGEPGELVIDTPSVMSGYLNNEQETREVFDSEGWLKTGDVVVYDEDGYFKVVDRIKELIKVKGLQVSPSELEGLLLTHPAVAEAGVIGVPDEMAGEVPRAYVVLQGKEVKAEELCAFIASQVAPHKQLAGGVEFVEQLPKNPTGKLLRKELKKVVNGSI